MAFGFLDFGFTAFFSSTLKSASALARPPDFRKSFRFLSLAGCFFLGMIQVYRTSILRTIFRQNNDNIDIVYTEHRNSAFLICFYPFICFLFFSSFIYKYRRELKIWKLYDYDIEFSDETGIKITKCGLAIRGDDSYSLFIFRWYRENIEPVPIPKISKLTAASIICNLFSPVATNLPFACPVVVGAMGVRESRNCQ